MPGVVSVQPRVGSLLSQVAQGVQVASEIYGIKHQSDMADLAQQKEDRAQQEFQDEQAGVHSAKELPAALKYGKFVNEGTPDAVPYNYRTGAGDEGVQHAFILPRKEQDFRPVADYVDQATGKHGVGFVDVNNPDGGVVGFVETAKAPKEQKTRAIQTLDENGNPQIAIVPDVAGATYPMVPKGKAAAPAGQPDEKAIGAERKQLTDIYLKGSGRQIIGQLKQTVNKADALETLVNAHPDFALNPQLQSELAAGVASLVMGGQAPTQGEIEKMDPQTRGTFVANLMQKFTNKPYDAGNPDFVKSFAETIAREKATAQDKLNQSVLQAQAAAPNLYAAKPDEFFQLVGANPKDFDTTGKSLTYEPKVLGKKAQAVGEKGDGATALAGTGGGGGTTHPQDNKAVQWAKEVMSNPYASSNKAKAQAQQILQLNGVK